MDIDDGLSELRGRRDLRLIQANALPDAERALARSAVEAIVVSSGVPDAWVNKLLQIREGLPRRPVVLAIRAGTDKPASWSTQGVGILSAPLLPDVLRRSLDVVLGLSW
jgi:hypothetical protein